MTADAPNRGSLLLLFFSDGAPSDQALMQCEHGVPVFQVDRKAEPLMQHKSAASAWTCRGRVHDRVKTECLSRVRKIGDVFGKEKVVLRTLAFGPPNEDFKLLEEMAAALLRGAFQKLGLNADKQRTAFSSLSSSMTELRTEGGGRALTRREKVVNTAQVINQTSQLVKGYDGWWIYAFDHFTGKFAYNAANGLLPARMTDGANGLAFVEEPFAEGAERFVYRCTEIQVPENLGDEWFWRGVYAGDKNIMMAYRRGIRLVAKEARDEENLERGWGTGTGRLLAYRRTHGSWRRRTAGSRSSSLGTRQSGTSPSCRPTCTNVLTRPTCVPTRRRGCSLSPSSKASSPSGTTTLGQVCSAPLAPSPMTA